MDRSMARSTKYKSQARVMKSLAHPTRLFIVGELGKGERCVCELTRMIGVEMPTVSRHLDLLKKAGILGSKKQGKKVFYRLLSPCVIKFLSCMDVVKPAFAGIRPRRGIQGRLAG